MLDSQTPFENYKSVQAEHSRSVSGFLVFTSWASSQKSRFLVSRPPFSSRTLPAVEWPLKLKLETKQLIN